MIRFYSFLIQVIGVLLQACLPYFLGKKAAETESLKEALKDVEKANAIRADAEHSSALNDIPERLRRYYESDK